MSLPGDTSGRLNSFKTKIWTATVGRSYFVSHFFETRVSQKSVIWYFDCFFFSLCLDTERRLRLIQTAGFAVAILSTPVSCLSLSSFSGRTNSWFDLQQGMVIVSDDCRYKNGQETKWFMGKVRCVQTKLHPLFFCWKTGRLTRLSVFILLLRISFFYLCDMNQFAKMYLQAELRNRKVGDVDSFFF